MVTTASERARRSAAHLEISEVSAAYGDDAVLDRVSFTASPGTILTLLGPSGCGKSTLLRVVAGLLSPTAGDVRIDGRSVLDSPPGRRDVAMVFQNYALYPHLSVKRNLSLALEARRIDKKEITRRITEVSGLLGIGDLLMRKPRALSGGQQQRVALGRALVREPRLYLLDEPLSNLDALLREEMRSELKALFRRLGATVLYVTHDQVEALTLADTVVVLERGRVRQVGAPAEVHRQPADLFVATFVGSPRMNLIAGEVSADGFAAHGLRLRGPVPAPGGTRVMLGIRPEDVQVSRADRAADATEQDGMSARITLNENLGSQVLLTLAVGDLRIRALVPESPPGERISIRFPASRRHWFDLASGGRLNPVQVERPPV